VIFSGQPERFDCVYKLYSISSVYVTHTHTHTPLVTRRLSIGQRGPICEISYAVYY